MKLLEVDKNGFGFIPEGPLSEGTYIFASIEEIIEMWIAAERRDRWFFERQEFEKQNLPEPPDFTTYLTSKGIQLDK